MTADDLCQVCDGTGTLLDDMCPLCVDTQKGSAAKNLHGDSALPQADTKTGKAAELSDDSEPPHVNAENEDDAEDSGSGSDGGWPPHVDTEDESEEDPDADTAWSTLPPAVTRFAPGERVRCDRLSNNIFRPATITEVNDDSSYNVMYKDGAIEAEVQYTKLRSPLPKAKKARAKPKKWLKRSESDSDWSPVIQAPKLCYAWQSDLDGGNPGSPIRSPQWARTCAKSSAPPQLPSTQEDTSAGSGPILNFLHGFTLD